MSTSDFEADLRRMIAKKRVVVIVGAGVSRATTSQAPTWRELIESAIHRCQTLGADDDWSAAVRAMIALKDGTLLINGAEAVSEKLLQDGNSEYARWLRETFENLQVENREVIEALAELDLPILTTNYDGLIEAVTGLRPMTWQETRHVARWLRGEDRRVLHFHGYWDMPESIVLGVRSYESVKNHEHAQAALRAQAMHYSLLLVGCGQEGIGDPNLGAFFKWLKTLETPAGVEHRHYRLVRDHEQAKPDGRLFPLSYGKRYEDLAGFLRRLRPLPEPVPRGTPSSTTEAGDVPGPLPASVEHYLRRLEDETATLTLLGMGRSLQVELPIDEAFVPLRTTLSRSLKAIERPADKHYDGLADVERDVEMVDVFREAAKFKLRGVILLGEPGSGKTTGARQLAWQLASGARRSDDLGLPSGMIPVLLRFRDLSREALSESSGLKALRRFLDESTQCDGAPDDSQTPCDALWNDKKRGILWILDGLDEVVDPAVRRQVAGWLREAVGKRPHDWFIVTCRFQGYSTEGVPLGPKFVEFHVRPLDDAQVEQFVRRWFSAAYLKLLGDPVQAEVKAMADSDALLDILARSAFQLGHIRELCTNPLLLTILCIVFHEERALPTGRAELYAHCVRVLLEYWRRDLYTTELGTTLQPYDAKAAQLVLARIAWWLHQEEQRTNAPLSALAGEAAAGLKKVSPDAGLGRDGDRFIQRMREETGILALGVGEAEACGFLHLSFQEYLAAEHAASEGKAREMVSLAGLTWWREVVLLSLRQSRPYCEDFFREMLAAGIAERDADLAERCLQEALYFAPEPFVDELRGESTSPRRVAAILRLLRERVEQVPELDDLCRGLATAADREVSGFAREILIRRGIVEPTAIGPQPMEIVVDDRTGLTFVTIPPGEFVMGSEQGHSNEKPRHRVQLTRGFLLAKYPVTNAQYATFLEAMGNAAARPEYWSDRKVNQPEQPVVGVSWHDAVAYCQWAGGRLPTEAEWEYACRAGTETEYCFGDDPKGLDEYAWYDGNSGSSLQPVGAKKPNAWGLHDMHGNVWEWCQDWHDDEYYAKSPPQDPQGPDGGVLRVFRGGGWDFAAGHCRSAYRLRFEPVDRIVSLGFRVACSLSGESSSGGAEPGAEAE